MVGLLAIINEELGENNIPYEFSQWKSTVRYPYFVGSYDENNSYFEDNRIEGTFTIDGWSRRSSIELIEKAEQIKEVFSDFQRIRNGNIYYIRFNSSMLVPTGVEDLNKITITFEVTEWKGEINGT